MEVPDLLVGEVGVAVRVDRRATGRNPGLASSSRRASSRRRLKLSQVRQTTRSRLPWSSTTASLPAA